MQTKLREFASLAAGLFAAAGACLAQPAGPIVGFGENTWGQLNIPPGNFVAVTGTAGTVVGIRADRTLQAWGAATPPELNVPSGTFKAIDGGANHYLGIRTDGTLVGWGYNFFGEASVPPGTFIKVSAGNKHGVGVRTDGSIAYWGLSYGGTIPTGNDFVDVAAGLEFSAALHANGTIEVWGSGSPGVPAGGPFVQIGAGHVFLAGLGVDGIVRMIGNGPALGNLASTPVVTMATMEFAILALKPNGELTGDSSTVTIVPAGTFVAIGLNAGDSNFAISGRPCYANCDGNTNSPLLTANDFQCFLNAFASSLAIANCDNSTVSPVLTANDFQCFLDKYAIGCS